jgi:hypothetical protein
MKQQSDQILSTNFKISLLYYPSSSNFAKGSQGEDPTHCDRPPLREKYTGKRDLSNEAPNNKFAFVDLKLMPSACYQ